MKNKKWLGLIAVLLIVAACSDITDTQRKFLDMGEITYVGRMDSVVALGGHGRAIIVAKNTYLRTATQCVIKWVDYQGASNEKAFNIKDYIVGDYTRMPIEGLPEGDYDFYIYNVDQWGDKSLIVDCHGSSYGDSYARIQPKIAVSSITVDDDNAAHITMSNSKMAVKFRLTYQGDNSEEKTIEVNGTGGKLTIPNWGDFNNLQMKVTTYILPSDKLGVDTLVLPEVTQTAKQTIVDNDVDKARIVPMQLTKNDDPGTAFGAKGVAALFDDADTECWGLNVSAPGHFCFDLGVKAYLSAASIVGRLDYPGWDVVKFQVWGRESLDDGKYGSTGYYIMASSQSPSFETEASTRKWKKVGNGWFKYTSPRSNPQTSKCVFTEVDHSFKPRYILFRVMSVLTPNVVPVPDTQYFGNEGGFYYGDGVNTGNRSFCIRELNFKALGVSYIIQ
ncbi:MAG: DUF4998 domain-containing protein [Bacteroidota bacterium]|nr:DUF4998 domain-containing protein [Bacteroidota bacterium]